MKLWKQVNLNSTAWEGIGDGNLCYKNVWFVHARDAASFRCIHVQEYCMLKLSACKH